MPVEPVPVEKVSRSESLFFLLLEEGIWLKLKANSVKMFVVPEMAWWK